MIHLQFPTHLATTRNILILLLAYLFFPMFALPRAGRALQEASGQANFQPLDLRPGFTPDQAWKSLEALGPAGRESYRFTEMVTDIAYPLVYGIFFALLIVFLFQQAGGRLARMTAWAWIPIAGTLFDWMENFGIIRMLSVFPERADGWAQFASRMGQVKWLCSIIALLYILIGLGALGMAVIKKRP